MRRLRAGVVVLLLAACESQARAPVAEQAPEVAAAAEQPVPPPELPFEPSPDDKPALGATGFTGVADVPPETGFAKGIRIHGVKPGSGLERAGVKAGDLMVAFAGVRFEAGDDDPIGRYRARILELAPDSDAPLTYWREGEGVREVTVKLGRQPPPFARDETPADWFTSELRDASVAKRIEDALALDGGEARYADVLARNRRHLAKKDAFRLREVTQAHVDLAANEGIAEGLTHGVLTSSFAASIAADGHHFEVLPELVEGGLSEVADAIARVIESIAEDCPAAAWTPSQRELIAQSFPGLTARINEGEYLHDDEKVDRERGNRRLIGQLAQLDRVAIAQGAADVEVLLLRALAPRLAELAVADGREGLLIARDSARGRIEVWGRGNNRHTTRCAFRFDLAGNDDWLDCAGGADLEHPVAIAIDWSGNDTYGGTSPFDQGAALGGVGILWDREGDDQYVARTWSQGCGVAGFGLLRDDGGRDVYHGQDECQGVGLAGAGVLQDAGGDDLYTGARFCQGVGFAGGVGALVERSGNDRFVCTGRYESEYGEPGLFSGWGQGVGFGFRHVASGGIGVLYDLAGDDVYEAGNFSQGGGYFYAWGILRDDAGNDRYIGSRYAQGFAAHQAVGTLLEGGGDDLYQSHSTVACGLSWDETSVVFHERGGNDVYEQAGFSLASAAHNGLVLFLEDAGDDVYAGDPAHAGSNQYHGGRSFALFVDAAGNDVYRGVDPASANGRKLARDEGAYLFDEP